MKKFLSLAATAALLFLTACASIQKSPSPQLAAGQSWAVLPFANHTETPYAAERVQAIAGTLLRTHGVTRLQDYPLAKADDLPGDRVSVPLDTALEWARQHHVRYGLTGSVNEWRYKVGMDGEPVVGLTLQLWDLETGQVIWSAVGSKSGWSRDALNAVGQDVLSRMLDSLRIGR